MATLSKSDLEFILQQIFISEAHAAGADLITLVPNVLVPFGLRTVDGSLNSLVPGQENFGAADEIFPRMLDPEFRDAEAGTSYEQTAGIVVDSQPRVISNLIVDQTITNPAAVAAFVEAGLGTLDPNGVLLDLNGNPIPAGVTLTIPNTTPDEGLSAPFNLWFVFFGQFFDHGLDLVEKGGSGTVFMPLQEDDPLFVPGSPTNFMLLTRATNQPGPDGMLGTPDDIHEHVNTTSPFVDQNQTYTSHPSHQVFLRAYEATPDGPVNTGKLITNRNLGDGILGNGDDIELGGMSTWGVVKAQARDLLGIQLTDYDAVNVPYLLTDPYGNFMPGDSGFVQLVRVGADLLPGTADDVVEEGNPGAPILTNPDGIVGTADDAVRTGQMFLADIAHSANPFSSFGVALAPDADNLIGDDLDPATYDDELLAQHFMAGDGRVNENIGLTAVHHVFHAEHNRQVDEIKATILASGDAAFIAEWQVSPGVWDGARLFQAAKFATEMQYQHLVFEEFARRVQPMIDEFLAPDGFKPTINPAIVAEFAHTVYRFGHSMLLETVDRLDPDFASSEIGLIEAFLNPLAFNNSGALTPEEAAGAIVRGTTRQVGNEVDEFKTEAMRNNLLGLPLDLAAINLARGRDTGIPTLNHARAEFFAMTSDQQLKPYTSWIDFGLNLKHPESLVNFIAAYGTHVSITSATTVADKRLAADLIVFGDRDPDGIPGNGDELIAPGDRIAFLNGSAATTGVDAIDFWVGGLAERQMPFGGLLGSTFNFVFETQLESLQNGDRFYYLSRLSGLNFFTELENNSFAKLIMLNTDNTHLPADVFSTPAWILEADPTRQFTGLGPDGKADPTEGGTDLVPLVIRDNPGTAGPDPNYLKYTGVDHVVLGGTDGDDTLIASIGDDTLWGDAGNDRLEGGDGVDNIEGGAGHDIITDKGGDDVLKGNAGHDVIHGGNGFNLILGGDGNDFIITGEDVSDTFGGQGNDFILGAKTNLPSTGNEGDDWIEIGTQDGAPGDNFDPRAADPVPGHDVFTGGGGFDEMLGEGGDDIFVASEGEDHFDGDSGFDWATYKNDTRGVSVDMLVSDIVEPPVAPSNVGIMDRFAFVEGLSGSAFSDILQGDDADAAEIIAGGAQGSVLDAAGIARIAGLQALLGAGVTSFNAGNIILGGDGSDIVEGRGGNDIIDGDRWLNVRIAVHQGFNDAGPTGPVIRSANSMTELMADMLSGALNPGQLSIVREILPSAGPDFDTAMYAGLRADYTIVTAADGTTVVTDNGPVVNGVVRQDANTGTDTLRGIERLQFSDQAVVLAPGNNGPVGALTIVDPTGAPPAVNEVLRVNFGALLGVTDPDNPGGLITGPVDFVWQVERIPGSGRFEDIVAEGGDRASTAHGTTFKVTADLDGLVLRVRAVYQDANGVLENVFSAPTAAVDGVFTAPPAPPIPQETVLDDVAGVHFIRQDLQFIHDQILIAEAHSAAGGTADALRALLPNSRVAFGLRTVDGSLNNLVPGQEGFGASDENFPLQLDQIFRNDLDGDNFFGITNTNFASTTDVVDADPRIISNLIVDQTANNPAAVAVNAPSVTSPGLDGIFGTPDDREVFFIPNTTPDEGLSAPFNAWFTFFGQFFDHGLDLVDKGGNGNVFIPLQADDPLIPGADGILGNADDLPVNMRFMILSRATNTSVQAGVDGVFGTSDDVHLHNNETTPFVDQNQTYTSNPSHQVFLREYAMVDGRPMNTGRLIDSATGGIANWAEVKAQAANLLGIQLTDTDVFDVPMVAVDLYGNFIPDPVTGFAQVVTNMGLISGVAGGLDLNNLPGGAIVARTGHAFLNDIAHTAAPTPGLAPDGDDVAGPVPDGIGGFLPQPPGTYDDELLARHLVTGDGRGNENIALSSVHHVFHSEHNRMAEHVKDVAVASNDATFLNKWLLAGEGITQGQLDAINALAGQAKADAIDALGWDGSRVFQAARFGTEMQYQHLVFEEFARKVQPQVDVFFAPTQVYDTQINPAIVAEFAHQVYRFGHSMLLETVDRFDPEFNVIHDPSDPEGQQIGLIRAFLNPLAFEASGASDAERAGAIIRGVTRQDGNEIDEFVTEALRNNLLGLPLDLATINLSRGRDTGVPTLNQARAEFYAMTGDSQLKPYSSWVDFLEHIKHPESLVNFIAAYGIHSTLTDAAAPTLQAKRAAASLLVFGGNGAPADRLAFLNSTGAYASLASGATITGVDAIDLWVGGLAEKQMPFGGLLGSTFNFVFETQMEKLQDGDRFYYLERTNDLNFLAELENNSFAKMIMANTDATHLPGDVFSTPAFILEVNQNLQFTGLGVDGKADPEGGSFLGPLVVRSPGALQYTGEDHVVLGGTPGNDTIFSSIGDDTLYGDGGDDRLEGGDGVDMIVGGPGDDIITDIGGDDNLQGGDGDDAIHGGNGINLIIGSFGNDFIVTGEDASEAFGGQGNDFIKGVSANEAVFGNEGDDWLELGMADGGAGDNFDAFGLDPVPGNDVFFGDSITDRMDGEGGDDIMIGNGGPGDRYEGLSGFDWALFTYDPFGVSVDMRIRAFDETPVPPSEAAVLARFEATEALSGSTHADILRGDDADATAIAAAGFRGSVLTNIALIGGLQGFLDNMLGGPVTSFGAGNIILGGDGSDRIEGGGGDDLIDGDAWLDVHLAGIDKGGLPFAYNNMTPELVARVFAGQIDPGSINIVRQMMNPTPPGDVANFDTAVFSDVLANYAIDADALALLQPGDPLVVQHLIDGVVGPDGTDTVRNIERLQFADQALVLFGMNAEPDGAPTIDDNTPTEDQLLTASTLGITDADGIAGPIALFWQQEVRDGVFEDILIENVGGETVRATGATFTPGDLQVGAALRVKAIYKDGNDVLEAVFSAPTAPVANVNDAPIGAAVVSDSTPTETQALIAIEQFTDADNNPFTGVGGASNVVFSYQWQQSALGGGGAFANIAGATAATFTPAQAQVNRALRVIVTYTDDQGTPETVISAATTVTGDFIPAAAGGATLTGTAGQDIIFGGGGADTINAGAEDDILSGDAGADTINGQAGNDTINYLIGDGADTVNGGAGLDTLNITGTAGADTLDVILGNGGRITNFEGGTLAGGVNLTESIRTDLLGGTDTLSYAGSGLAATVNLETLTASGFTSIAGIENVTGGNAADVLTGNALANSLSGQDGADTLSGGAGADILTGGGNDDVLFGGADNDTLDGGAGADTLDGGTGNDTMTGGGGNDILRFAAGFGSDVVTDFDANPAGGQDLLDISSYGFAGLAGNVAITVGQFVGGAGSALDTRVTIGADVITLANVTGAGANVITDTDFLIGSGGGGNGGGGGGGGLVLVGDDGPNVLTGSEENDNINGQGGADTINGLGGNDTLMGGAGADLIDGGAGADGMTGGPGNDTFVVDDAGDSATEGVGEGTDLVQSSVTFTLDTNVENLTLTGTGNINGTGNGAANTLTGNAGDNILSGLGGADNLNGGGGNDTLDGGAGNDNMTGGAGNDTFVVDAAGDTVNEAAGGGTDTILSSVTFNLGDDGANVENLTLTGAGNINGTGNGLANIITGNTGNNTLGGGGGADTLLGGAGNDTLNGNGGADTLDGGAGNDTMNGGAGNDIFVFGPGFGFGNDIINGFDANPGGGGQDLLNISALGITAATFAASVTIADLGANTLITFTGQTDSILLNGVNGVGANVITQADFVLTP